MKRPLRLLLILAPLVLLLLGIPLGVTLAQRSATPPEESAGGIFVKVAATSTPAPRFVGPRQPTRAPRLGPPVPTNAPRLGPTISTSVPAPANATPKAGTPAATSSAQNGLSGTVIAIDIDRFTVFTKAQRTAVVIIDPGTTIRFRNKDVPFSEMMIGDDVTVLGHRDTASAFHAELIRVVRPIPTPTIDK